ncbi:unnamed protein product [Hymenolepis diminuta]|uniref:Uncharacterized protein n=1 Tax=Hymenolepis diminuta TaxID=6216 RepID=A0A564YTG5_HYMDI|nr:unnamed protein product [Hymenolepis diminuta]
MFSRSLTQVIHIKLSWFSTQKVTHACRLSAPMLPSHLLFLSPPPSLLLASVLIVAPLNTFWFSQLLVFCSTIVVSSYSNGYKLVTVVGCLLPTISCYLNPNPIY